MSTFSKVSPVNDFIARLGEVDGFNLTLLVATLTVAQEEIGNLRNLQSDLLHALRREEKNRKYYDSARGKQRHKNRRANKYIDGTDGNDGVPDSTRPDSKFLSWEEIRNSVSDNVFRRKFRMSKQHFELLCSKIRNKVGDEQFRTVNNQGICGFTKVAVGLRILCVEAISILLAEQSTKLVYRYFHTFIDWVDETFDFPWVKLLQELNDGNLEAIGKLREISFHFAADSSGSFEGCIGAIDGIAIRIRCPSNVSDPCNYFCRKNFYALNVQAICDRQKRILWISPGHQGASHNSTAWLQTSLADLLEKMEPILKKHGLFIVGDSAYRPYPNTEPSSIEDAFNFWLSNSRIHIECTFGEFIARFGLFWRTLKFDTTRSCDIIRAAAKLHNFLIDCREGTAEDDRYFWSLSFHDVEAASIPVGFGADAAENEDIGDMTFPLVTDNNQPKPAGRKANLAKKRYADGKDLCDSLCVALSVDSCPRPKGKRMRYSDLGHVYFE
ncbi:hypothetical protein ACHAWF_002201 [Thalassiosira exigua]